MRPLIIAANCRIDGQGSLSAARDLQGEIVRRGFTHAHLNIAPLSHDWDAPLPPRHFRSGCAPLEALAEACRLLSTREFDSVTVRGRDFLRSDYAEDRTLRNRCMAIYGEQHPLTEAYTGLAQAFCRRHDLSPEGFRRLCDGLFDNHRRSWEAAGESLAIKPGWFEPVTDLFRLIDCANPVVDFEGEIVLATVEVAEACAVPLARRVAVLGVGLGRTSGDGPEHVEEIAEYNHLTAAYDEACGQAGVDFRRHYLAGEALLEAYTCYPVVPLAFLLASGIAAHPDEIPALLERRAVTVTGGMNLARAAWNNPALRGLIALWERLAAGAAPLAALHGNGGLGYHQGVAILGTLPAPA